MSAATGRELKIKGDYRGVGGVRVLYLQILKVVGSLNARHVGRGSWEKKLKYLPATGEIYSKISFYYRYDGGNWEQVSLGKKSNLKIM